MQSVTSLGLWRRYRITSAPVLILERIHALPAAKQILSHWQPLDSTPDIFKPLQTLAPQLPKKNAVGPRISKLLVKARYILNSPSLHLHSQAHHHKRQTKLQSTICSWWINTDCSWSLFTLSEFGNVFQIKNSAWRPSNTATRDVLKPVLFKVGKL